MVITNQKWKYQWRQQLLLPRKLRKLCPVRPTHGGRSIPWPGQRRVVHTRSARLRPDHRQVVHPGKKEKTHEVLPTRSDWRQKEPRKHEVSKKYNMICLSYLTALQDALPKWPKNNYNSRSRFYREKVYCVGHRPLLTSGLPIATCTGLSICMIWTALF